MKKNRKDRWTVLLLGGCLLVFFIWNVIKPPAEASASERRKLAQFPKLTAEALLSGDFAADFEEYAADQFPLRDAFRTWKARVVFSLFGQLDNNGIYLYDGHAASMEYPLHPESIACAAERFRYLYETYLQDSGSQIYGVVVPDKNEYLAEASGHLRLDYEALCGQLGAQTEFIHYIEIRDLLSADDYYRTDPHWRQEALTDVAERIAGVMGVPCAQEYREISLDAPFYGAYCGQAALPLESDTLVCLTNEMLEQCTVYDFENDREIGVYDWAKAEGRDPYEVFLSGSRSLISIENPSAASERELIVFRDSFGSSLAPLLVEGYRKVTLVDIRYLPSERLGNFLSFHGQDVLFVYSTLVLNASGALK